MEADSMGSLSHHGRRDGELSERETDRRGEVASSPRMCDPGAQAVHTAVPALFGAQV